MLRTIKSALRADRKEVERRREICRTCPNLQRGRVATCALCGCLLVAKIQLQGAACPARKWEEGDSQ